MSSPLALDRSWSLAVQGIQAQTNALAAVQPSGVWWSQLLAENLASTTRIAADMGAISQFARVGDGIAALQQSLGQSVAHVVDAHGRLLASTWAALVVDPTPPYPGLAASVITPTVTTAAFTRTARETLVGLAAEPQVEPVERSVEDLARRLRAAGASRSADDLEAAFEIIKGQAPGFVKGGAHLTREVITHTLHFLAPNSAIPPDANGQRPRRRRVLFIVSGSKSLARWADAVATGIDETYATLSAEAHSSGDARVGVEGLLGLLETAIGLIRVLLDQTDRRNDA